MSRLLTLQERVAVACEDGLWRTYSDCYTHENLDHFRVPKTWDELTAEQQNFLNKRNNL